MVSSKGEAETLTALSDTIAAPSSAAMAETLPADLAPAKDVALYIAPEGHRNDARYVERRELGAGGMGRVAVVFDHHMQREVALKQLHGFLSNTKLDSALKDGPISIRSTAELRFVNEARITGQLDHPGVIPVYDLGQRADGSLYYTMRLLRGRTLSSMLLGRSLLQRLELLPQYIDLCNTIAYAHKHRVVHRDLKPDNVMLGDFGETVVLDWGLAKVVGEKDIQAAAFATHTEELRRAPTNATIAGAPMGTPAYMPPEQARGDLEAINERADVYALGAILYELLTARPPYTGESALAIVDAVLKGDLKRPREIEAACPPELEAIALRALQADSAQRYPDAIALAADVRAFLTGGLVGAHRYGLSDIVRRWIRRNRRRGVAIAMMIAVASLAFWYRGKTDAEARHRIEQARIAATLAEVDQELAQAASGGDRELWFDTLTFKLISLKEPAVEQHLIQSLGHSNANVRKLVARSLGGMKSEIATDALIARLGNEVEPSEEVLVEVIRALGIIGDARANAAVVAARNRAGGGSYLFRATDLTYRLLPLPPLVDGGASFTAQQWLERGVALYDKQDPKAAVEAFDRALTLDPKFIRALTSRGLAWQALGDRQKAEADYTRALELDPDLIAAYNNRATNRRSAGNYAGALADYNEIIRRKPDRVALSNRLRLQHIMGDAKGAMADAEQLVARYPNEAATHAGMGLALFTSYEWKRAREAYSRAISLGDATIPTLWRRGRCHYMLGDRIDAMADFSRILELDPSNEFGAQARAFMLVEDGEKAEAAKLLNRMVDRNAGRASALLIRAVTLHAKTGAFNQALEDLQKAVVADAVGINVARIQAIRAVVAIRVDKSDIAREALGGLSGKQEPVGLVLEQIAQEKLTLEDALRGPFGYNDSCEMRLVAGVTAELAGNSTRAADIYRESRQAQWPMDGACDMAEIALRALTGNRPPSDDRK